MTTKEKLKDYAGAVVIAGLVVLVMVLS